MRPTPGFIRTFDDPDTSTAEPGGICASALMAMTFSSSFLTPADSMQLDLEVAQIAGQKLYVEFNYDMAWGASMTPHDIYVSPVITCDDSSLNNGSPPGVQVGYTTTEQGLITTSFFGLSDEGVGLHTYSLIFSNVSAEASVTVNARFAIWNVCTDSIRSLYHQEGA